MGVPHAEQNARPMVFPLSEGLSNQLGSPRSREKSLSFTTTTGI